MMEDRNPVEELQAAGIGAAITTGVQLLFLLRPGAELDWRSLALATVTGAVIGWGYRLATGLRDAARETLDVAHEALDQQNRLIEQASTRLERTTKALDVQQKNLRLLLSARIHKEAIWKLVSASLKDDYRLLAYVSKNKYLNFLKAAISASNKSVGVKRTPIRSYRNDNDNVMETYLRTLRDKPMNKKVRVFILDAEQAQEMEEDLANSELMDYYWKEAGEDISTYWITTPEFKRSFPPGDVPNEFAIYDDELLIEYDEPMQTLRFGIIQEADNRLKIFEDLAEQERNALQGPFRKLTPLQTEAKGTTRHIREVN